MSKNTHLEVDHKKLGREGLLLLGGIDGLKGAIGIINGMREEATDAQRRAVLEEVCFVLMQGVDEFQRNLAQYAIGRGIGKVRKTRKTLE